MKKIEIIQAILKGKQFQLTRDATAREFAPANIALCKYWGKRDRELNLPMTSSLSISLGTFGTTTHLEIIDAETDRVAFNDDSIDFSSSFYKRLINFLNLFREENKWRLAIKIESTIPLAAGLASSASGFASLIKTMNLLFNWQLDTPELSILARLGSGSACRSIDSGFVEWNAGVREDGMDSYGKKLASEWSELCIGLLIFSSKEKLISSREAMERTVETCPFYRLWPKKVEEDYIAVKQAIQNLNFHQLGTSAESNALAMHALMMSSWPPVIYSLPETLLAMQKIWALRQQDLAIYFTQDAGPNLKLLFLKQDQACVLDHFPTMQVIHPFE